MANTDVARQAQQDGIVGKTFPRAVNSRPLATGEAKGELAQRSLSERGPLMSVFLPTTPNPTSGFLLYVPKDDVIVLEMSVEDAAKLIISAGLVYPNAKDPSRPAEAA